jgi:hypothetical protein
MRLIPEGEFRFRLQSILLGGDFADIGSVTGPGRSGDRKRIRESF